MDPANVELALSDIPEIEQLLEVTNTPTAGPPITATIAGDLVVFQCATWRPILEARLDDAINKLQA